jgi:hypothetical protein
MARERSDRDNLGRVLVALDQVEARACAPEHLAWLLEALGEARVVAAPEGPRLVCGQTTFGRVRPYGSVVLDLPASPGERPQRLIELDRQGHVSIVIRRGPTGSLETARVRALDGRWVTVLPGGAEHPLWGPSDRIVTPASDPGRGDDLLTVCAAVDWDAVAAIPALADPTRLPAGAGIALLNLLAAQASDQARGPLRYRGPYPTEQLFWSLLESFRLVAPPPDPLATFLEDAEEVFERGASREAPLDWEPAPHERLFLDAGVVVHLRDGVEKVQWEGRSYYRREWSGIERREHRVLRAGLPAGGQPTVVASLEVLGEPLQDHLVFDECGNLLERPASSEPPEPEADEPLAPVWRTALAALLPLEATPLLAPALDAVWPGLEVAWGAVHRDLVESGHGRVRLARVLSRAYQGRRAGLAEEPRRALARRFVRDVLGLVGPPARTAAAAWLESQPAHRQEALLREGAARDRREAARRAAATLAPLVAALASGEALPD